MMDRFMSRLLEGAASAYMPRLEEIAKVRKAELHEIKMMIHTNPEQVERWFDKEIMKLESTDIREIIKDATAGI